MNFRIIKTVIAREYVTRVKKKSFLIITFVVPVLFALFCLLPSILMFAVKEKAQRVAVVDRSGIVMPFLQNDKTLEYVEYHDADPEDVKTHLESLGLNALLVISPIDEEARTVGATIYSDKPIGVETSGEINSCINKAVENYRIDSYRIEGLQEIMKDVKADVRLITYTLDAEGNETVSESGVYMAVSMLLGMLIYMFIALFSGMVMSSVIEEKSSRVVEVLVSSVKAIDLLFGKIIGVAMVAITQFLLWILLTFGILAIVGGLMGTDVMSTFAADPSMEMIQGTMPEMPSQPDEMQTIFTTLGNMPIGTMLVSFLLYFVLGYLLYASLFAAIGSAVENEADSQQLQIPITIPLMIGFFISFMAYKNPDSGVVFWGSMIPFTSPIVMLSRIPYGVPMWELLLSFGLLAATFVACAWASAKIYKVGILMFGKKSTFKDLWKWLKQS